MIHRSPMECCCASCFEVSFADFVSFSGGMYSAGVCGDSVSTTNLYTVTYAAGFISGAVAKHCSHLGHWDCYSISIA